MAQGGVDSADYLRYVAEGSGNVGMDGMFSIQVLSKALEVWSLTVVALDAPEAKPYKEDPTTAQAFICNLQEHWFTLRRVASGESEQTIEHAARAPLSLSASQGW